MTNEEVLSLSSALNSVGNLSGVKFAYCIAKNLDIVNREVKVIQKAIESSKEFNEYDQKRVELAKKYSKKDDKGKEVVEGNQFVLADEKGFNKELEVLRKANKKVLEAREEQIKSFNELLKEKSDIKLYQISLDEVPEAITTKQMSSIILLIKDEPNKTGK